MVEAGQGISATIRRDFEAEVGDHDDPEEKATMSRLLDALFAGIDDDEGLGGHLTLTLTLPKTLTLALTLTQTLTLTLTLALTLSLTLTVTRPRRSPPPGQPTPRAPPGLPRLRRRPAQHGQRLDRDERVPLPLHRGASLTLTLTLTPTLIFTPKPNPNPNPGPNPGPNPNPNPNQELGAKLTLKPKVGGGSDAAEWINVSEDEPRFAKFMAAHKPWVERVREHVGASTQTSPALRGPLIAPEAAAFEQALGDIGEI